MFAACVAAMGLIPIDRVVTAPGRVVSRTPTLVVQPLEMSIVPLDHVAEGQRVQKDAVLARLDPTFAAADVGGLAALVSSLQAEVSRLQREAEGSAFTYSCAYPYLTLQASIFAERQSERKFKRETYAQRISGLEAAVWRGLDDDQAYRARKDVAEKILAMRKELERLGVGAVVNTLAATDNFLEAARNVANTTQGVESARARPGGGEGRA